MKIQTCVYIAATVANILHALRASFNSQLACERTCMHCTCLCIAARRCGATTCTHSTHTVFTYCSVPAVESPWVIDSIGRTAGFAPLDTRAWTSAGSQAHACIAYRVHAVHRCASELSTVTLLLLLQVWLSGCVAIVN